jgi:hypothetical protein
MKWEYLENLSTTTMMQSKPEETGNPFMKSIVTTCHAPSGVLSGSKRPGYETLSAFAC